MSQERRHDDGFKTAVLTQLGDIKALCAENHANHSAVSARVTSLEKTNSRQWWLHGAQALIMGALGVMRKAGVL